MYRIRTRQRTLRGLGDSGILSTLWSLVKLPITLTQSSEAAVGDVIINATPKQIWGIPIGGSGGDLTANQVKNAANVETQGIIKASGGTISYQDAAAQASADQTALHNYQLQHPIDIPQAAGWIIAAMGIFLVIEAVK